VGIVDSLLSDDADEAGDCRSPPTAPAIFAFYPRRSLGAITPCRTVTHVAVIALTSRDLLPTAAITAVTVSLYSSLLKVASIRIVLQQ